MNESNELWIVKSGSTYLPAYAGITKQEVYDQVLKKAWEQEKFRGSEEEKLSQLGWEIVKVKIVEI